MVKVEWEDEVAVIDVREQIRRGEHPRQEILELVLGMKTGTVVQIHLPHRAQPLASALESKGMPCVMNELAPDHFRLMCVKL